MLLRFYAGFQGTTYNQNLDPSEYLKPRFLVSDFFVSKYPIISLYWSGFSYGFLWFSMVFLWFFFLPVVFCSSRRCALLLIREAGCCRSSNPRLQLVSTNWGDSTNSFSGDMSLQGYLYIYIYTHYIYYKTHIYIYIYTIYILYILLYIYICIIYLYYILYIHIVPPCTPNLSFHVEKCETRTVLLRFIGLCVLHVVASS